MTLSDFLASADSLVGREVTVEGGWLHSDAAGLWLADRPHSDREAVIIDAPHIAEWLVRHIPPRLGGVCAYCHGARVTGTVQPRDRLPVIGGQVRAVLDHTGKLHV